MPEPDFTIDQRDMQIVAKALRAELDGKQLRKDLIREMKGAAEPARDEARAAVLAIPTSGGPRTGEPLRQAIAERTTTEVRLSGRSTGVRVRVKGRGMPRGFRFAGRMLNRPRGWRHRVFGRDVWVSQTASSPRWFDGTMRRHRDEMKTAVREPLEAMARRIADRVRSRT